VQGAVVCHARAQVVGVALGHLVKGWGFRVQVAGFRGLGLVVRI